MKVKLQSGLIVELDDELAKGFINTGRATQVDDKAKAASASQGKKKSS